MMKRTQQQLRDDMLAIWRAGVEGVLPERLIRENVQLEHDFLVIDEVEYPLSEIDHITVIGAGKASGTMAKALEDVLRPLVIQGKISGWVNVPDDCVQPLQTIHLHGARPAGVNEPTEAGVWGTEQMLRLVESRKKSARELVIALISGGGSALLPVPSLGITLEQKLAVTRFLSAAGATISEINTVRKQLSAIKGGGLKRLCSGRSLVSLILSDVIGDPLDVIASGPTMENQTTAMDAVKVLEKYQMTAFAEYAEIGKTLLKHLREKPALHRFADQRHQNEVRNLIIGNNATAVDAAGMEAEKRGYSHAMIAATGPEGLAEDVGLHLLQIAQKMQAEHGPDCLISGGEPVVQLVTSEKRGFGGRNQQLVLAALAEFLKNDVPCRFGFLSGGTDGEDGPTDAAGAFFDNEILERVRASGLNPSDYLTRNDAYHFFERVGGLLKTGPTGTNVCDIRVIVTDQIG